MFPCPFLSKVSICCKTRPVNTFLHSPVRSECPPCAEAAPLTQKLQRGSRQSPGNPHSEQSECCPSCMLVRGVPRQSRQRDAKAIPGRGGRHDSGHHAPQPPFLPTERGHSVRMMLGCPELCPQMLDIHASMGPGLSMGPKEQSNKEQRVETQSEGEKQHHEALRGRGSSGRSTGQ